jgi:L-seryl-tRNA(Ser) seleniumtransferase
MGKKDLLRQIPGVDEVIGSSEFKNLLANNPRHLVVERVREVLDEVRKKILKNPQPKLNVVPSHAELAEKVEKRLRPNLKKVVNATGVILHTNLGRAPLSKQAQEHLVTVSSGYSNLEIDLHTGKRGSRYMHVIELLCKLTGAEDAMVVNNNAAAVFLALNTLARQGEVVVWRGELIEIGGSFRLPEIMSMSGAFLREVGTTNKVYTRDYEEVITENTALLMKIHPSNFRIVGFTREVSLAELIELGNKHGLPVLYDAGSGALIDFKEVGLPGEPTIKEAVKAGVAVATFSGDKLLGGPQAGLVVGKKEFVEKMKRNHLNRALRIDKLTLAALEITLRHYFEENPWEIIPVLEILSRPVDLVKKQAKGLAKKLSKVLGDKATVNTIPTQAESGGGAFPNVPIPSHAVSIKFKKTSPQKLQEKLRENQPPIIARVEDEAVLLDMRTIFPEDEAIICAAFASLV